MHQLARELAEPEFVRLLLSAEWTSAHFANQGIDLTKQRRAAIERLTSDSVASDLADLRSKVRPTRNEVVHAVDPQGEFATVDDIERFIRLTLELSGDAVVLSTGNIFDVSEFCALQDERAQEFWSLAFARPAERKVAV
jgi:hypothetical protein